MKIRLITNLLNAHWWLTENIQILSPIQRSLVYPAGKSPSPKLHFFHLTEYMRMQM